MSFTPRPYQVESINAGAHFFNSPKKGHAFQILPTGSGKSVVIANTALRVEGRTLVLQPSKEILEQNFAKYTSYGFRAGIYSASFGSKDRDNVTFATIGSIARKPYLFRSFENIIMDECHYANPDEGMYNDFFNANPQAKVLGLTATPYRLYPDFEGAQLKFLNRTSPRIFSRCIYYIQNDVLFNAGHLAKLDYFPFDVINRGMLEMNKSGTDYTDASLKAYYRTINMPKITIDYARKILAKRKNLLVFCALLSEAYTVAKGVPGAVVVDGDTDPALRAEILRQFKAGKIRCVINVGVLTTGFDYPELEAVLIARSTMSLALYYQIVGRVMRPHPNKLSGWVVDLGGNIKFFGKIETMRIEKDEYGGLIIRNNGRQLTDVPFSKN